MKRYLLAGFLVCCGIFASVELAAASDQAARGLFKLSRLPLLERSKAEYLTDVHQIQSENQNNQFINAFSNILKADYYLLRENFAKAENFLEKVRPLIARLGSESLALEFQYQDIFLQRSKNNIDQAISLAENLLPNVINAWPKHKVNYLILEMAYLHSFKYQYEQSLILLQRALEFAEESQDPFLISETYNLFGIVYSKLKDHPSATMYYQKAVALIDANPELRTSTYTHSNLADSLRVEKKYEQAEAVLTKALRIAEEDQDIGSISFANQMFARLFADSGEYEKATEHMLTAAELSKQIGEELFEYVLNSELSDLYLKAGQLEPAKRYFDKAKALLPKLAEDDMHTLEHLKAKILFAEGNYQDAYQALDESYSTYRNIFNENLTKVSTLAREELDQQRLKFDNRLLEKEKALSKKNEKAAVEFRALLWALILLLVAAICILVWFLFRFKAIAQESKRQALTDNLTQLPNRRMIFRKLSEVHRNSAAKSSSGYSVILFDIDRFKSINDRFGHHIGDKVIQQTKAICQPSLGAADVLGRIGGEEFLIILPHTKLIKAKEIAEKIRQAFETHNFEDIVSGLTVTSSFGVSESSLEDANVDFIVNRADRLLYKAKHQGRNKVVASFA
ncbi:GGDEF domain-containing protein [Kangiella sp. TOML190]|uniref:GGDEF domain-containing protein n=1 Tax=Kangiella sp. TOML190 TaxID=2931351 RepID=UPI0020404319|nr:GGDEF domain-containing protein [Kangiella sp. TOML190]